MNQIEEKKDDGQKPKKLSKNLFGTVKEKEGKKYARISQYNHERWNQIYLHENSKKEIKEGINELIDQL